MHCVVAGNIHTPSSLCGGHFSLDPHPPGSSIPGGKMYLSDPLPRPTPFCNKERENPSIHVITVSNYLNFAL